MTEPTDQVVERLAERITNCVCTCHTDDRRYEGRCHACCGLSIDDIRAALREALRIGREQQEAELKSIPVRPPFQKELTVILTCNRDDAQADKDIEAIQDGRTIVLRFASEHYFHQLRLRCEEQPELHNKIAVFYLNEHKVLTPIGLRFEDELKWPAGFLTELIDKEVRIQTLRRDKAAAIRNLSTEE